MILHAHSPDCFSTYSGVEYTLFKKIININYDFGDVISIPYSPVVRIPGFHPGGPGSIPGVGTNFFIFHWEGPVFADKPVKLYFIVKMKIISPQIIIQCGWKRAPSEGLMV